MLWMGYVRVTGRKLILLKHAFTLGFAVFLVFVVFLFSYCMFCFDLMLLHAFILKCFVCVLNIGLWRGGHREHE